MKNIFLSIAAAASLAGAAQAETPVAAAPAEARIPIFQIRDFQPRSRETLYVQTRSQKWYRVETMGRCEALPYARNIAVDGRAGSSLDRFSTLLVGRDRCPVASVVRSEAPPSRMRPRLRN